MILLAVLIFIVYIYIKSGQKRGRLNQNGVYAACAGIGLYAATIPTLQTLATWASSLGGSINQSLEAAISQMGN